MVAYSFQKEFIEPIQSGRKRGTIRAIGKRRHACGGDALQLYYAMRTRHCTLIGRSICTDAYRIVMKFDDDVVLLSDKKQTIPALDVFAYSDGFENWEMMKLFWRVHHPGVSEFHGVRIMWGGLVK